MKQHLALLRRDDDIVFDGRHAAIDVALDGEIALPRRRRQDLEDGERPSVYQPSFQTFGTIRTSGCGTLDGSSATWTEAQAGIPGPGRGAHGSLEEINQIQDDLLVDRCRRGTHDRMALEQLPFFLVRPPVDEGDEVVEAHQLGGMHVAVHGVAVPQRAKGTIP